MTVAPSIDPARLLEEQLAQASPDLLRELLTLFVNTLMSAQADAVCGAEYGAVSAERTNRRNGYRSRAGTRRAPWSWRSEAAHRQLLPECLLERRKRAEAALTSVVATCYLLGVSTRPMEPAEVVAPRAAVYGAKSIGPLSRKPLALLLCIPSTNLLASFAAKFESRPPLPLRFEANITT